VIVAVGAGLLLLVGWAALRWERDYRANVERAKRATRPALDTWIRKRRLGYVGGALLIVSLASVALAQRAAQESPQDPSVAATSAAVSSPKPGDKFSITFLAARSDGSVEGTVANETDRRAYVQCIVDALDASGSSVIEGSYEAFEPNGDEYQSEAYSTVLLLNAGSETRFEVNLRVEGSVASVEGSCGEVPKPPTGAG
jgi:hypothetical protein